MAAIRPSGIYDVTYEQDMSIYRTRVDWFWGIFIVGFLILLPLLTNEGPLGSSMLSVAFIGTITNIFIFIIAVSGLNILLGYTGQISLGQAAFIMVGAYSSQVLVDQFGWNFFLAFPVVILFTGFVGILFGLPSLRVKGFYLAMATLAAQFIIPWFIKAYEGTWFDDGLFGSFGILSEWLAAINLGGATGKQVSAPTIPFTDIVLRSNLSMYYVALMMVIIFGGAARNLVRSRIGRALISVRDNDLAAEQLGINVFRYKLLAFFLSAVYAGAAGALFAHSARSISPDAFNLQDSIEYLGMLIIGGLGFPLGATFGVAFFFLVEDNLIPRIRPIFRDFLPDILPFIDPVNIDSALLPMLFGLTLVIFLIFEPRGLAYRWAIMQASWKLRPFSQA